MNAAAETATTIRLTGGRGVIVGELVHANPHYTVMIQAKDTEAVRETLIPAKLIAEVIR